MFPEKINLISFGIPEKDLVENIALCVKNIFMLPVLIISEHIDLSEFYDPARRQYNGTLILEKIDNNFSEGSSKTVGLFAVDLFIPILTFIFGQAYLNGRTGIASYYRLSNERYGVTRNDEIMYQRFRKEVIHELGHLFGLVHCHDPLCVMRSSTYVEDIDQKNEDFCHTCRNKIGKITK